MSPVSKSVLAALGIAAIVGGTLMLRSDPQPKPRPQLTPSQLAELGPQQPVKPEPPKVTAPKSDPSDLPPPPEEEPEIEDGNGS
jgi:hypothetical protein